MQKSKYNTLPFVCEGNIKIHMYTYLIIFTEEKKERRYTRKELIRSPTRSGDGDTMDMGEAADTSIFFYSFEFEKHVQNIRLNQKGRRRKV